MPDSKDESHEISLAVWDLPSPLIFGDRARVKVGVKCSAGCSLNGQTIAIQTENSVKNGGTLGSTPWPGTAALYWSELEFDVPPATGKWSWKILLLPAASDQTHREASSPLPITIVAPPEHRLAVTVLDRSLKLPIADADIRLGPHKGATNSDGLAQLDLPKGMYELTAWKHGYKASESSIEIKADSVVHVELEPDPEPEPEYWMG